MNKINTIIKIITALAAVVGAIYIIATFGDKIVAWAKNLVSCRNPQPVQAPAEEAPVAEQEEPAEAAAEEVEAPVQEEAEVETAEETAAPTEEDAVPTADEADFEG